MGLPLSLPTFTRLSMLFLVGWLLPLQAVAQTVQTSEYIYIGFEAEDHVAKNERWVLTTPSTPTEENDPDGNHSDQASGSTYLELLPDVRVTHDDTFGPPTAYWGQGGQGPDADYLVDFPEPGRYYVHVRAYSTGTEDNGLHVGINGTWPASGQRMQFCTAHRRAWWWSSAQRDAGGNGSCGIEKSIWLDVPSAGVHTVSISAREDGFEIDRLVLLKDLSNNTRICEPTNISNVECRNGSIESADGFVDLRVRLEAVAEGADPEIEPPNPVEVVQGSNIELTAKIENLDGFDTANDIVLTLTPAVGDWNMIAMDDRCTEVDDEFNCTLNNLHPTAPNEYAPFVFTMQAKVDGDLRIDAGLLSAELDESPANDVAATILKSLPGTAPVDQDTDVQLSMDTDKVQYETGESIELLVSINNLGMYDAEAVTFDIDVPAGLSVNTGTLPAACTSSTSLQCTFATIAAFQSESLSLTLLTTDAGLYTISGNVGASNDDNSSNNLDSDSVLVEDPQMQSTTDGDTEGGDDSSAGTTDTGGVTAGSTTAGSDTEAGGDDAATTMSGTDAQGTDTSGSATSGETSGTTAGSATTDGEVVEDTKLGATTRWFVLLLILLYSARLYGRHQRQCIAIRK